MAKVTKIEMRYFSPVKGRVVERFGSGGVKIGATRGPKGYTINLDAVVAIPKAETLRYVKEYRNVLRDRGGHGPDLIEREESDFVAFQEARRAKSEALAAELKAKREADANASDDSPTPNDDSGSADSGDDAS